MATVYREHDIERADELMIDDSVYIEADSWAVIVTRLDGVRDDAGRAPYRLEILNEHGKGVYRSDALSLHDNHDPVEAGAGWAAAILDPGSGYSDDCAEGDERVRVQAIRDDVPPGEADEFSMIAMRREEDEE